MNWQEICEERALRNLPYKIETDQVGKIIMSPVKVYHSAYQGEITRLMPRQGKVLSECAIKTSSGTKVADVAWVSDERFQQIKHEAECSVAPEICVEVLSHSNTETEIRQKKKLYFEKGAKEVWVCNQKGTIRFYSPKGVLKQSNLIPDFPKKIHI